MAGLVAAHLNSPPPKPSTTNPELPQQLDRVIATGMAKDPDLRYQTTLELAAAANAAITPQDAISPQPAPLQPVTEVAPVHAPPTAPSAVTHQRPPHDAAPQVHQSLDALYPTSSTPRRRRPALIAAALAVVGIVVITVATLRMTGEEPVAESPPAPIGTTLPFTGLVTAEGVAVGADNSVYAASYDGNQVLKLAAGASTPTVLPFPGLFAPTGVAVGTDNSVYVADTGNQRVLKLAPDSTTPIELPFPDFHAPRGVAVGADNTVYVANREYYTTGQGQHWVQKLAPGATAPVDLPFTDLYGPYGVAVGTDNAVYVTDAFSTERNRVMKLDPGASTPVELPFTGLDNPSGVAVGADNTVYIAPKENLLKAGAPIFIEGKYTDLGKWMDGWETRRRRSPGFDWCIIRLGLPGIIRGVVVDTSFFRGNYPGQCSIEACTIDGQPDIEQLTSELVAWTEILPLSQLNGDSQNHFAVQNDQRVTHLRFRIFPDGGVARLRVYGEVTPDWNRLTAGGGEIDLAAVENGGLVLTCSDMFFGHQHHLIMPGRAVNMSDGWETKRRRGPGYDWLLLKLGRAGHIRRLEVDTSYFKGNFPESCSMEACNAPGLSVDAMMDPAFAWKSVLPRTKLQAHTRHYFDAEVLDAGVVSHLRFNIFPDGGVSRLRVYGNIAE